MYKKLTRLVLFLAAVSAGLSLSIAAQPDGYVEAPKLRGESLDRLGCYRAEDGVYDEQKFKALASDTACGPALARLKVDFEKETPIRYSAGGDCHMQLTSKVFRNDAEKKYKLVLNNIYGGCRAGGSRQGWVVIEKIRPGYTFESVEVRVDRIHGIGPVGDFTLPKPPSTILREHLETREIDPKGCLTLTGQSQWVISTAQYLRDALDTGDDKNRCRELFENLKIGLERYTLAGYSFSSGYCSRPKGLKFETTKETSSDPSENRLLLKIGFDDPGANRCQTWTTYPLWVVVPKLPESYSFEFDAKADPQASGTVELETRPIGLKGCIQTIFTTRFVIRTKAEYLAAIRKDASHGRCIEIGDTIDLEKYTLAGIKLNSGYCGRPIGLEYRATKDDRKKQYALGIGWDETRGICRAISEYDLWVLVPKMPTDYGLVFDLNAKVQR